MVNMKDVRIKGIQTSNSNKKVMDLLAPFVGAKDCYNKYRLFKGIAYTNELDRDGEQATHSYLVELASKLIGVPVIKNHNWNDVDGIVGRVVSADVVEDKESEYIEIMFYAVKPEDIRSIEDGLYYGLSVGSLADHDNNLLVGCGDAYEISLVVVPAVPGAHITKSKKSGGGSNMDETLTKQIDELRAELNSLRAENQELKTKNEELCKDLDAKEEQEFHREAEDVLEHKVDEVTDEMEPVDEAKSFIKDELKSAGYEVVDSNVYGAVALKCGKFISFKNFDVKAKEVKNKYNALGLLGKHKSINENKSFNFTPGVTSTKFASKRGMSVSFN